MLLQGSDPCAVKPNQTDSGQVVDAPSMEAFQARLDDLLSLKMSMPMAGWAEPDDL